MSTKNDKSLIINDIKKYYKIDSDAEFARFLGIKPQTLASWRSRNSIDYDLLSSVCVDINMNWVITGEGYMLNADIPNTQFEVPNTQFQSQARNIFDEAEFIGYVNEEDTIYSNGNNDFIDMGNGYYQMMVPLIEDYAYAGYLSGYSDEKYLGDLPRFPIIVQKQHKGSYRSIRVKGDSMDDNTKHAICSGDVVVGRKIEKDYWKSKIHYTTWPNFIIVHEDGIVIKSIIDHDVEKGTITCRSLNPDKDFYPDFKLHLNNVYELYNIVQIIRLNF